MQTKSKYAVSIVIPVYGGEKTLPELVSRIKRSMTFDDTKGGYEILLICDQSPDNSWDVIKKLAAAYPGVVKGVLLRMNAGQHNALMAGFARANGQIIVTMDDDLQHSPEDIKKLLVQVESGKDVVYADFINRHHPLWKIAGSRLNNLVASYLIKKPKDLYLSPFRAFRAVIKDEILRYQGPYVYVDGLILSVTKNIGSVQVKHYPRFDGRSNYGIKKSISLWLKMATSFSIMPLRLTSIMGMIISLVGFFLALLLIIQKLTLNLMPVGWSSLIVTILIIGGLQLLAIGMVGEYLGRVLLTINSRSQYVVADTISLDNKTDAQDLIA